MKYSHAQEQARFDQQWERFRAEYRRAGMEESAIEAIYRFDLECFNSDRRLREHLADLPFTSIGDVEESVNSSDAELKISRFLESETIPNGFYETTRYGWIDEIENQALLKRLKELKAADLELLTQYVFDEKTQKELAREMGITQGMVCKKIARIKNFLKKR